MTNQEALSVVANAIQNGTSFPYSFAVMNEAVNTLQSAIAPPAAEPEVE